MIRRDSKYLEPRHVRVIDRIGDLMFPQNDPFPSFSQLGVSDHIDMVVAELPKQDLKDLRLLLTLLSFMPTFFLAGLLRFLEWAHDFPGPIGAVIRMVRFGLRGIVVSLYYSGRKGADAPAHVRNLHEIIGYKVTVYQGRKEPKSSEGLELNQ